MGYVCLPVQSKTSEEEASLQDGNGTVETGRGGVVVGFWAFLPGYHVFQHMRNMSEESAIRVVQVCVV